VSPQEKLDLALQSYAAFSAGPDVEALIPQWTSSFGVMIEEARIAADGRMLISQRVEIKSSLMGVEVSEVRWQEGEFTDHRILRVTELGEPPAGWDTAEHLDIGSLKAAGLQE
jgi:hypothetical protein